MKQSSINFSDESIKTGLFCQIDQEIHGITDVRYECNDCGRIVCGSCFELLKTVKKTTCPNCEGLLAPLD